MTLNLWILNDWLEEYSPVPGGKQARQSFTGTRLYRPGMDLAEEILYIAPSHAFFGDGDSRIVCKTTEDHLTLDTDDLLAVFNRVQDAFSFYARWYNRCVDSITAGCTLPDLIDHAEKVFSTPIMIVNAAQIVVAHSRDLTGVIAPEDMASVTEHQSLPAEKLKRFNQLYNDSFYSAEIYVVPAGFFPTKSYCKHVFLHKDRLGTVILKAPHGDLSPGTQSLLALFTTLVEEWIRTNEENAFAFRLTSFFVRTLDGHPGTLPVLLRQLSLFGWEVDCRKQVYVLSAPSGPLYFDMRLTRTLSEDSLGVYMIPYHDRMVLLCDLDILEQTDFMDRLQELMTANHYCGASSFSFTDLEQLLNAYHQAETALDYSPRAKGKLYRCQDVSMRIVAKVVAEYTSSALLHPAVAAIKAYDRQHHTDYHQTLFCFLQNERRHSQTAQALFIHRNTLFLRLEKIQELWPLNWEDNEERFYLLFSFYQDRYAGAQPHPLPDLAGRSVPRPPQDI